MDMGQKIELGKSALQFASSALWPGVALILAFWFEEPIERLIDRIRKVGSYFEATSGEQQQSQDEKPSNLAELEQFISKDVTALKIEETKRVFSPFLGNGKDREEAFFKIIASMTIAIHHHRLYAAIFGSQLSLLFDLNAKPAGVELTAARQFYDRATQQFPENFKTYSFEQWLGFLTAQGVVEVRNGAVFLSVTGASFLNFLIKTKQPLNRIN